jgi:D-amino-acid dehydrogenase
MRPPDPSTPVIVLGAGIVGICTALSLLERGVPVTLIDRGDPGQATSYGNAGVVSPVSFIPQSLPGMWQTIPKLMMGYARPLSIHPRYALKMLSWGARFLHQGQEDRVRAASDAMANLCGPSIDLFKKHLNGTGHEGLLVDTMYLQLFRDGSKPALDSLDYRIRAEKGAEMEVLGQDELSRLEPAVSSDFKAGMLVKGTARVRSPGRLATVLADKAARMGATFIKANIRRVRRTETGWIIHCEDGDHRADRIVMCLGAWSADLLPDIRFKVPLISERGYHAEFATPGIELNNSVMDADAKFIASSMEGGVRVAGHAEFAPPDAPPSKRREKLFIRLAKATFPDLQTGNVSLWTGCRPSFPDSLPMIDRIEDQPGLFTNFGHSHFGLMMSPASGELVAQLVCGDRPNVSLKGYSAKRFGQ